MGSNGLEFELVASSLRADAADLSTFVEALAAKLEGAVPYAATVERKGGFFSGAKKVRRITVQLGEERFSLNADGARLEPTHAKAVRGIVLKTEILPLDAWIEELSRSLADEAQRSEQARIALERLVT